MLQLFFTWLIGIVGCGGPDIFKFTAEPESQTVEDHGVANLTCEATNGEHNVHYRWYRLRSVKIPPDQSDMLNFQDNEVQINISKSDSRLLFQCVVDSNGQRLFSRIAKITVSYIEFTGSKIKEHLEVSNTMMSVATPLTCLHHLNDIKSNRPFEIQWYKGSTPISALNHSNFWVSPVHKNVEIQVEGSSPTYLFKVKPYDLVFYNLRMTDSATFYCKAVQDNKTIKLATWTLLISFQFLETNYFITEPVLGYISKRVSDNGILNNKVRLNDEITLLCGGVGYCSRSNILSFAWHNKTNLISVSQRVVVRIGSLVDNEFTCTVRCSKKRTSKLLNITVDATDDVKFVKKPPDYILYIIGKNLGDIRVPCEINQPSRFMKKFYMNGIEVEVPIQMKNIRDFKSGALQCMYIDMSTATTMYQATTQLAIVDKPRIERLLPPLISVGKNMVHVYPTDSVTFGFRIYCPSPVTVEIKTDEVENGVCDGGERESRYKNEHCSVDTTTNTYNITINNFQHLNQRTYTIHATISYWIPSFVDLRKDSNAKINPYKQGFYKEQSSINLIIVENCTSGTEVRPSGGTYNYGTAVNLTCTARGFPPPSVTFLKNDVALGSWEAACLNTLGRVTCTLTIAKYSDTGSYSCMIYNNIRNKRSYCNTTLTSVTFVGRPFLDSLVRRKDKDIARGSCAVEGNPVPRSRDIYWKVNGTVIQSTGNNYSTVDVKSEFRKEVTLDITRYETEKNSVAAPLQCCFRVPSSIICKTMDLPFVIKHDTIPVFSNMWHRRNKILIGCVIGGALLIIIIIIIYCLRKRNKKNKKEDGSSQSDQGIADALASRKNSDPEKIHQIVIKRNNTGGSDVTYAKVEFTPKNKNPTHHPQQKMILHDVKLQTAATATPYATPYATVNAQLPPPTAASPARYANFGISRDDEAVRYENYRHRSHDDDL